jgi:putative ABC transport system permease protein
MAGRWASNDTNALEGVVNETLARRLWGGDSPIGRELRLGFSSQVYTVVGVVADAHILGPGAVPAILHAPPPDVLPVMLLATASPALESTVRSLLKGIAPSVSVQFVPLTDSIRDTVKQSVGGAMIAGGLGLVALLLAMIGVHGVFSYVVEERRREIGIRLALGARRRQVRAAVFAATGNAIASGLVGGLLLSVIAGMLLRRFLFGMSPADPISYVAVGAIVSTAALAATYVPIQRALRCNPAATLRAE